MATYTSNVTAITFNSAQYLFRVYHVPIVHTDLTRIIESSGVGYWHLQGNWQGFELNYNDHLFSLPPTLENLAATANSLAYAESLLYVHDSVFFIAVWLIESAKPIDEKSPATVFHCWRTPSLEPFSESQIDTYATQSQQAMNFHCDWPGNTDWFFLDNLGFKSYDLTCRNKADFIRDPFVVLDIARECETGPMRHTWCKGVLGWDDYYYNERDHLHLTNSGSLALFRFPWYQATLENMPYTHSSYSVARDGKLEPATPALTYRVANLAVNAAQARRRFVRHSRALQTIWVGWWYYQRQVIYEAYRLEKFGFLKTVVFPSLQDTKPDVSCLQADANLLLNMCRPLVQFLNLVTVGCGSESLALQFPGSTAFTQLNEYNQISQNIFGFVGVWEPVAQEENSTAPDILLSIADLVGGVLGACWEYQKQIDTFVRLYPYSNYNTFAANAQHQASVHNAFAAKWPQLQGDLNAAQALMCSWQFAFRPVEPSRAKPPQVTMKSEQPTEKLYGDLDRYAEDAAIAAFAPHFDDRIAFDIPVMAPNYIWDCPAPPTDLSQVTQFLQIQASLAALHDNLASVAQHNADAKAARMAAMAAHIQELKDDLASNGGANPLDVWDWRNWSRKEWWLTPVAIQDAPTLLLNAINTPDILTTVSDVWNFSPRVRAGLKRYEPLINGVAALITPQNTIRGIVKDLYFRALIKKVAQDEIHTQVENVQNNVKQKVLDTLTAAPQYSPRQFWPQ